MNKYTDEETKTMRWICESVCCEPNQGIIGIIHGIALNYLNGISNHGAYSFLPSLINDLQDMQKMCVYITQQPYGNGKYNENTEIYRIALREINGELDKRKLEAIR